MLNARRHAPSRPARVHSLMQIARFLASLSAAAAGLYVLICILLAILIGLVVVSFGHVTGH